MWGAGSVIRGSGSQIRGAGSAIRRDPPQFNPCLLCIFSLLFIVRNNERISRPPKCLFGRIHQHSNRLNLPNGDPNFPETLKSLVVVPKSFFWLRWQLVHIRKQFCVKNRFCKLEKTLSCACNTLIGTARVVYKELCLWNGTVSIRLSDVCPLLQVCCCGPGGQEISIDCCPQRRAAEQGCSPKKRSGGRLKQDLDKDLQLRRILILLYWNSLTLRFSK